MVVVLLQLKKMKIHILLTSLAFFLAASQALTLDFYRYSMTLDFFVLEYVLSCFQVFCMKQDQALGQIFFQGSCHKDGVLLELSLFLVLYHQCLPFAYGIM